MTLDAEKTQTKFIVLVLEIICNLVVDYFFTLKSFSARKIWFQVLIF